MGYLETQPISYYNPVQYELIISTIKAMLRMREARTDGNEQ